MVPSIDLTYHGMYLSDEYCQCSTVVLIGIVVDNSHLCNYNSDCNLNHWIENLIEMISLVDY